MTRYAALLRGVNVGGIILRMADLADEVRALGYGEVRTVLASGNVLFETIDDVPTVKEKLERALRARFDYDAWVHVIPIDALRRIVDGYPFERSSDRHGYVVFVADQRLRAALLATPLDPELEQLAEGDEVLYWTVRKGMTLHTAFGTAQGTKAAKPYVTNRNLNTLERLLA